MLRRDVQPCMSIFFTKCSCFIRLFLHQPVDCNTARKTMSRHASRGLNGTEVSVFSSYLLLRFKNKQTKKPHFIVFYRTVQVRLRDTWPLPITLMTLTNQKQESIDLFSCRWHAQERRTNCEGPSKEKEKEKEKRKAFSNCNPDSFSLGTCAKRSINVS